MLDLLSNSVLLGQIALAIVSINLVLSAAAQILHNYKVEGPAVGLLDKVVSVLVKVVDWLSANVKH